MTTELRILSPTGNLGAGYPFKSLELGLAADPNVVAVDNGSTDPGPYYLGSGEQSTKPTQVRRDLRALLQGARRLGIPLVIGNAGTAGGEPHLSALARTVSELAKSEGLHFRMALIHAEIDKKIVKEALAKSRIHPMPGVGPLTEEALEATVRIVGQMGIQPFREAFATGAEVILAGRSCDSAIFASFAAFRGHDIALAMHLAHIMECGASCAVPQASNDCLLGVLRDDHFVVEPTNPARRCTPASVITLTLYEQPDAFHLREPAGTLDMSEATYEQLNERAVKVSGSRWRAHEEITVKLEGARPRGYRTVTVAGARDPGVVAHIDAIEARTREALADTMEGVMKPAEYSLRMIVYGRNGVMGPIEPVQTITSHELGVVLEAIAPTQELADSVLALARSVMLHANFEGRRTTAGNFAFPFSPSEFRGGPIYEFSVYHLMHVDDPGSLFRVETVTV